MSSVLYKGHVHEMSSVLCPNVKEIVSYTVSKEMLRFSVHEMWSFLYAGNSTFVPVHGKIEVFHLASKVLLVKYAYYTPLKAAFPACIFPAQYTCISKMRRYHLLDIIHPFTYTSSIAVLLWKQFSSGSHDTSHCQGKQHLIIYNNLVSLHKHI